MAFETHKLVSIVVETVLGEDQDMDQLFFEYLDEYSITHKIIDEDPKSEWPKVEYTSGPIALRGMLQEKFGFSLEEIAQQFPECSLI